MVWEGDAVIRRPQRAGPTGTRASHGGGGYSISRWGGRRQRWSHSAWDDEINTAIHVVEAAAWAVSSETAADGGGSAVEAPAAGTTSILLPSASQVMEVTDFPLTSVAPKRWPVKAESAIEAGSCKKPELFKLVSAMKTI